MADKVPGVSHMMVSMVLSVQAVETGGIAAENGFVMRGGNDVAALVMPVLIVTGEALAPASRFPRWFVPGRLIGMVSA